MLNDPNQRNPIPQPPITRSQVAAGLGFAAMWCLTYPLYRNGYISKDWGTLLDIAAGACAYAFFESRRN
jgi:hypothetical protein